MDNNSLNDEGLNNETVAKLAYRYWQERGSPTGSSEEDWYRAEQELNRERAEAAEDFGVPAFTMDPMEE